MARRVSQIIEEMQKFSLALESSISPQNDIEITEHGMGIDLAQNGLVVHLDHAQLDRFAQFIGGRS